MIIVGLENTSLAVDEDSQSVDVCAVVTNDFQTTVSGTVQVTLATRDGTAAGNSVTVMSVVPVLTQSSP